MVITFLYRITISEKQFFAPSLRPSPLLFFANSVRLGI